MTAGGPVAWEAAAVAPPPQGHGVNAEQYGRLAQRQPVAIFISQFGLVVQSYYPQLHSQFAFSLPYRVTTTNLVANALHLPDVTRLSIPQRIGY